MIVRFGSYDFIINRSADLYLNVACAVRLTIAETEIAVYIIFLFEKFFMSGNQSFSGKSNLPLQ